MVDLCGKGRSRNHKKKLGTILPLTHLTASANIILSGAQCLVRGQEEGTR